MDEKIMRFRKLFHELFDEEMCRTIDGKKISDSYIEILDDAKYKEVILGANREGFLYLIGRMLDLCEKNFDGVHYHFDQSAMVGKCEREIIIRYSNPDWESD